jgi:hypothetical protein
MPLLAILEVDCCFISLQLAKVIQAHNTTLQRIALRNCFSGSECWLANDPITWAEFFDSITSAGYPKLREVSISPSMPPMNGEEDLELDGEIINLAYVPITASEANGAERIEHIKRTIANDPHRRLFAYAVLDDKYGMLFEHEEKNAAAFFEGRDQVAFDKFMAMVESNG